MTLRDDQQLKASADVLSRLLDGEAVLLHLGSGTYFGLNEVGSRAWEVLAEGCSVGELRSRLLGEFEVDEPTLESDLEELVGELVERGLAELE